MSDLIIGLSIGAVVIVIAIIVTVLVIKYTKKSKTKSSLPNGTTTTPVSNLDYALKNVIKAFDIKTTAEHFTDIGITFRNANDLMSNMMEFITIALPNLDINEINKILLDNGLNKTAQQIFDEHKNDNYAEYKSKFNVLSIISDNRFNLLTGTDEEIKNKIRLFLIIVTAYVNIIDQGNLLGESGYVKVPYDITLPDSSTVTISQIYMTINNDWATNEELTIYTNTDLNRNIPYSDAVEKHQVSERYGCLTNKLCKETTTLTDIINHWKTNASGLEKDIHDYINLKFAISLFKLNGTPVPLEMNNKNNYYRENYVGKLFYLYK